MHRTIIGKTVRIRGNLTGDDDVTISGKIVGNVHTTQNLNISPTGCVEGEVGADFVEISGIVTGSVTGTGPRGMVEIAAEANVRGDVKALRILIADGAVFCGSVDMN